METNDPHHGVPQQLQVIQRGENAPWFVYPATPPWWALCFALWAAVLVVTIGYLDGTDQALGQLGLIAVMGGAAVWDRRRRGTYPTGRPPRELRPAIARLALGAVVVAGLTWLTGEQLSVVVAAIVAAAGAWTVVSWYERSYATIAARVREHSR